MTKIISVIDSAYRASLEEQDDAGLWFSGAVRNSGLDVHLLLSGNAVNYATTNHSSEPMTMGGGHIAFPMDPNKDIARMMEKGAACFVMKEDLAERGLSEEPLLDGVTSMSRESLADFLQNYDQVWHW